MCSQARTATTFFVPINVAEKPLPLRKKHARAQQNTPQQLMGALSRHLAEAHDRDKRRILQGQQGRNGRVTVQSPPVPSKPILTFSHVPTQAQPKAARERLGIRAGYPSATLEVGNLMS